MTSEQPTVAALFSDALAAHSARDTPRTIDLTRQVLTMSPDHSEALEHLATVLITRKGAYDEGLQLIECAVTAREGDAGLWYSLGWCYEFAAHEITRRPGRSTVDPRPLYERAGAGFRRCLELRPEGKLQGDAEDLLDHVENVLSSL